MTFADYMHLKMVLLAIALIILAFARGLTSRREKCLKRKVEQLETEFQHLRPADRLPSKREKRKMKWKRREIAEVLDQIEVTTKVFLFLFVAEIIAVIWFSVLNGSFGGPHCILISTLVGPTMLIITNVAGKDWRWYDTAILLFMAAIAGIVIFGELSTGKLEKESATLDRKLEETTEQIQDFKASRTPKYDDEIGVENALVERILSDDQDLSYWEHKAELDAYTDVFGVDLDRLLEDYGFTYAFREPEGPLAHWEVFRCEYAGAIKFFNRADDPAVVWMTCTYYDVSYDLLPYEVEAPDIVVSLHEAQYLTNRKTLALLMEFLDRILRAPEVKEKSWDEMMPEVQPRDAEEPSQERNEMVNPKTPRMTESLDEYRI